MQTRYVNIYFDPRDAYLTDIDLVRLMQDEIRRGRVDITSRSVKHERRLCYSIKVTGELYTSEDMHNAALNMVYM
jgi:hypothetical protein